MASLVELVDAAEHPVLLRVEEAARVLTIGRSLAYRLAEAINPGSLTTRTTDSRSPASLIRTITDRRR